MLQIFPYHQATASLFKKQQSIWEFFSNNNLRKEHLQEFKTDLLKNTYKFDELTEPALYQKVLMAKEKLGLQMPITLYQEQYTQEINASIAYLDHEAHIVFSGPIIQLLSDDELLAIISHELSHALLYIQSNGDIEIAGRIINAIAGHHESTPAYYETARLFKLYTEIFCDRGAYLVTGSYAPIITSLVKIATGLQTVNADSYVKQAEDIFSTTDNIKAAGVSHPENFIRARAIWLWHTKGSEAAPQINRMIEGDMNIEEIDIFRKQYVSAITESIIKLLLQHQWMCTPQAMALAKQYFWDLELSQMPDKRQLSQQVETLHTSLQDYLAYVLYDFTTVDKQLEDLPLGYAFFLADDLKLEKSFANAVKKEKKLTDKKTALLKKKTLAEFQKQDMLIS